MIPCLWSIASHVGGLRNVWNTSASVLTARETSARMSEVLNRCLEQVPNLGKELLSSLRKDDAQTSNEGHSSIDWIRSEVCEEIASLIGKEAVDGEPINDGTHAISTRGHLFSSWAAVVNDPAAAVAKWIFEGAVAGISEEFEAFRSIFPAFEPSRPGGSTTHGL